MLGFGSLWYVFFIVVYFNIQSTIVCNLSLILINMICYYYVIQQMTTVGYGSTAPTSEGGRAMVFTLGFLSIVIFAGVNIKAGGILSAIVDDVAVRSHLSRHVTRPWVFAVLWGVLYYMWMCVIAR